jgi:hypothetical protein
MDHVPTDPIDPEGRNQAAAQRSDPRDSLFLTAKFRLQGETAVEQVRVRNLSAGGLMIELADDIDPDTPVEIEVRGLGRISGKIAWRAVGRAGIAFDKPVDPKKARKPVGKAARPS